MLRFYIVWGRKKANDDDDEDDDKAVKKFSTIIMKSINSRSREWDIRVVRQCGGDKTGLTAVVGTARYTAAGGGERIRVASRG